MKWLYGQVKGEQNMNNISVYRSPVRNTLPLKSVSLFDIAKVIKSDKYKYVTEKLRSLTSKDEKALCKTTEFDYTTFSGAFSKRANDALLQHSNNFCIDFDHVGNNEAIRALKQQIRSVYEPALMFVSPSGDGLKVVFQIDITQGTHELYFTAFQHFFKITYNVEIDEKCKDVSRACFLCYDPECFTSDNPTILGREFITAYTTTQPTTAQPLVEILTDQAIIIERLKVWINKTQSFIEGNRNKYISELCGAFNRYGVNEHTALETLLPYSEPGFIESEIRATVRSIYNNTALHNTAYFEALTGQEMKPKEPEAVEATPLMPIDGFPEFIQQLIIECTRIYGTHRDLWTAAFFAATSTALGQSVMLKTQYENTALLWLAVVGASGVGKSEPFRFAFKLLHDRDYFAFEQHKKDVKQYAIDKKQTKQDDVVLEPPPHCKQNIIVDATPEAMAKAMSANPRGITILRDELHGWFMDFGRYAKSGEQQNMLSTWTQQVFKVLRSGSEDLFIKDPFANVFGGIQPGVLPEMAKENRGVNGFLPRFCFVFPDKIETPRFQNEELDTNFKKYYDTYIDRLLSITGYRDEIRLNREALELYGAFVNKNADINDSGKQADYLNEVNAKLNIIVLRAAIVFHFAEYSCTGNSSSEINKTTMQAAINLTEYFRITAKKVFNILNQSNDRNSKKDIAKYLMTLGNSQNDIANVLKVSQQYISKINK